MYDQILRDLRESYNRNAATRDTYGIEPWKVEERQHFLSLLQTKGCRRLLEIGAGPGRDSKFFQDQGLDVICTDLSPEMVALCQSKGLTAYAMDFLNLAFPDESFDAVYALNCLLHVPKNDFRTVLAAICRVIKPSGLFFLGMYGGQDHEGVWAEDVYNPKRFFSFYTDDQIQKIASEFFELLYFKAVAVDGETERHFQSMILKRGGLTMPPE
jgi:SAM-dependent methyltransferase